MKNIVWMALSLAAFSALAQTPAATISTKKSLNWEVKKETWSSTDERNFQQFVLTLGRGRAKQMNDRPLCGTTDACIKHPIANPAFFNKNPANLKIYSDCADLPFILRAYFAWMNDLPFTYPTAVSKTNLTRDKEANIRYTAAGNRISARTSVKTGDSVNVVMKNVADFISSAYFRVNPAYDTDKSNPSLFNDFYSAAINRKAIVPGSVFYHPAGHVLVVYEVTKDGKVFMIDAHPDNSLTREVYNDQKFVVSNPNYGAGFKNWRPVDMTGGQISALHNNEIENYSDVQYIGTENEKLKWKDRKFILNGEVLSFGEFVRRSLADGNLKYEPIKELRENMKTLCDDIKTRITAVDAAIANSIQNQPHPERYPVNIYGTTGLWEDYSSPSRDNRLKAGVKNIKLSIISHVEKHRNGDPIVVYTGSNLIDDLTKVYKEESAACGVSYKNSRGVAVTMTIDTVVQRLYKLSFDPYNCIERRWGADSAQELATCTDDENKTAWYNAGQNLRNTDEINYVLRMDKTVAELPTSGLGSQTAEDLNIKNIIQSLR